jgi:hypothetical protein
MEIGSEKRMKKRMKGREDAGEDADSKGGVRSCSQHALRWGIL